MKTLEYITQVIGWLQIAASPLLIGTAAGLATYIYIPGPAGVITGTGLAVAGLLTGIILATRIWKKRGTVEFMSGVTATPDLDKKDLTKTGK